MTLLLTRRARARRAAQTIATLRRWADIAGRRLARLLLDGHERSPAAAVFADILVRLGAALRRVAAWVGGGA